MQAWKHHTGQAAVDASAGSLLRLGQQFYGDCVSFPAMPAALGASGIGGNHPWVVTAVMAGGEDVLWLGHAWRHAELWPSLGTAPCSMDVEVHLPGLVGLGDDRVAANRSLRLMFPSSVNHSSTPAGRAEHSVGGGDRNIIRRNAFADISVFKPLMDSGLCRSCGPDTWAVATGRFPVLGWRRWVGIICTAWMIGRRG